MQVINSFASKIGVQRGNRMTEKYRNKYRIASSRLAYWDYGANALYFVTMCCKNRSCYFGDISDRKMILSEIGKMAEKYWLEIPQHFPFVVLHNHVIMPNHVHGIIEIAKSNVAGTADDNGMVDGMIVETQNFASLRRSPNTSPSPHTSTSGKSTTNTRSPKNKFGPQSKNLASIVRGYKIGVTKNARQIRPDFAWQPRFYDHIIRNDESYQRISNYIFNNPIHWKDDKFQSTNQS